MEQWTQKAVNEAQKDDTELIIYLCKGDSSTDWWQQAAAHADVLATIDQRLTFGDGENSAPFASHVFVFGDAPTEALDVLAGRGLVLDATATHDPTEQMTLASSSTESAENVNGGCDE